MNTHTHTHNFKLTYDFVYSEILKYILEHWHVESITKHCYKRRNSAEVLYVSSVTYYLPPSKL
jgi:hypothetical protein